MQIDADDNIGDTNATQLPGTVNLFQALRQTAGEAHEKLAIMGFEWITCVVVQAITEYADSLVTAHAIQMDFDLKQAYRIIDRLFWSEQGHSLTILFFRSMIAKAGMKVRTFVNQFTSRFVVSKFSRMYLL
jgi:hypothetical protein